MGIGGDEITIAIVYCLLAPYRGNWGILKKYLDALPIANKRRFERYLGFSNESPGATAKN